MLGLGLSVWQAMLAGVIGYFVSCALVGILAVGSVRTGLPTLVQSRFAFGYHGNKIPTFFGYVANMGWKVTMLSMASTRSRGMKCTRGPGSNTTTASGRLRERASRMTRPFSPSAW